MRRDVRQLEIECERDEATGIVGVVRALLTWRRDTGGQRCRRHANPATIDGESSAGTGQIVVGRIPEAAIIRRKALTWSKLQILVRKRKAERDERQWTGIPRTRT